MNQEVIRSFSNERNEWYLENVKTGRVRKLYSRGYLLVDDNEIDMDAIKTECEDGIYNAERKAVCYEEVHLYDGFKDGYGAISWMLYPDGMYFADSDGFGMEDNYEVIVYAIIDANLDIVEPFRPIRNIGVYLRDLRTSAFASHKEMEEKGEKSMRIYNLIITDESGSMQSIKRSAIDSVNETLQTIEAAQQKHKDQEHLVTMVNFNSYVTMVCDCVPVSQVKELDEETYRPACSTALYDAIGSSLTSLHRKVGKGDKVLVTVVTDGYENASREYNGASIKALVDELKNEGWVFAYIGANHDVEAVAATISITNVMHFQASVQGTKDMSRKLSSARERLFDKMGDCSFDAVEANVDFFKE